MNKFKTTLLAILTLTLNSCDINIESKIQTVFNPLPSCKYCERYNADTKEFEPEPELCLPTENCKGEQNTDTDLTLPRKVYICRPTNKDGTLIKDYICTHQQGTLSTYNPF